MSKQSQRWMRNKKQRIYVRSLGICHYCQKLCKPFGSSFSQSTATLDHVQTRAAGGGNEDQNLVLACARCNNVRSCIPYLVFVGLELWRPENRLKCQEISRLFSIGAQPVKEDSVWLVTMYFEDDVHVTDQVWGIYASLERVDELLRRQFPTIVPNEDNGGDFIGYHFKDGPLTNVSFVASPWSVE